MVWEELGYFNRKRTVLTRLLDDSSLLDDEVWRIFEIHSLELTSELEITWAHALCALARSGRLDRQRLLDASLKAVVHQTTAPTAKWCWDLHERLSPSLAERVQRECVYLELLAHQLPGVVSLALGALGFLALSNRLSVARFLKACAPVFAMPAQAQSITVLKILTLLAKHHPTRSRAIATAAASALAHRKPDVQRRALALIRGVAPLHDPAIVAEIASHANSLAASVRPIVSELLQRLNGRQTHATSVRLSSSVGR
jgi:hypothetical protein